MDSLELNIGASNVTGKYRKGWINLDLKKHNRIQVIGDALNMPFRDNSVDLIHCVHVLEHVTRDKYQVMLDEMYRVLKPGAEAFVEVPDFERIVELLMWALDHKNKRDIHIWTTSIYGKNERPGMAHHWGFTEDLLLEAMSKAGFEVNREWAGMISSHYKQEPVILVRGTK